MSALRDALGDLSTDVFFDLLESDEAYLLVVDVPGVTAETVDLSVIDRQLVLEADRDGSVPDEYESVEQNRSDRLAVELPLPGDASDDAILASVERGVLEVRLPKDPSAGETTIDVTDESEPR